MTNYVNSIQNVSITIAALSTSNTATITAAVGTQFIVWNGQTTTATTIASEAACSLTISGTTVTATRQLGTVGAITVAFQVVDATSSLIKTVQSGTVSVTAGNVTGTTAISAVTAANTVIQYLGFNSTSGSFALTDQPVLSFSGTTLTATCGSNSLGATVVGYMVIEFQGAAMATSVQAIHKSWTTAASTQTNAISAVTMANTLLFYAGNAVAAGRDIQYATLTTTTNVTLTAGAALSNATIFGCYVVNFVAGVFASAVQRGTIVMTAATSNTATITGTGTNSMVNFTGMAQTSGSTASYDVIESDLTYSTPTVTTNRATGTGNMTVGYEVADWAVNVAPGGRSLFRQDLNSGLGVGGSYFSNPIG
jgi:hypothetical protein